MRQALVSDLIKALQKHLEEDGDLPVRLMLMNDKDYGATFTKPLLLQEEGLLVLEEDYSTIFEASIVLEANEGEEEDVQHKLFKG